MKLAFISDKYCWSDRSSPTGYATVGGFSFQMDVISQIFDQTRIVILERKPPSPPNLMPLIGNNLSVHPLKEPSGIDWGRKLAILPWLIINGRVLWREIREADVLHINVPGDLGGIAILLGLTQKKKMFIRHCGTWGQPVTLANRVLHWLLEKIADEKMNLVLATGAGINMPSLTNPSINWIFSTTLHSDEIKNLPGVKSWQPGQTLKLISVCRLTERKNIQALISALPIILAKMPDVSLDVMGDGEFLQTLVTLTKDLGLGCHVSFHGNVQHIKVMEHLSRSHVFVFPTLVKEGFPKALLEAMACGLPIIASRRSVIPYLVDGCGILLPDTNPNSIANAIFDLVRDPLDMQMKSRNARQTAGKYTLEKWQTQIRERLELAWGPLKGIE